MRYREIVNLSNTRQTQTQRHIDTDTRTITQTHPPTHPQTHSNDGIRSNNIRTENKTSAQNNAVERPLRFPAPKKPHRQHSTFEGRNRESFSAVNNYKGNRYRLQFRRQTQIGTSLCCARPYLVGMPHVSQRTAAGISSGWTS